MQSPSPLCSFAIFPFLKTTAPVQLGQFTFRATADLTDLSSEESEHLQKIMQMLFLQDDLRITSASYTKIPYVPLDYAQEAEKELRPLEVIQAVLAYCYGAPQPYQDRPFLEYEHASLAVLSPGGVSVFMVRPEHSAVALLDSAPTMKPDGQHFVPGYSGVLNFKHYFWLAEGSRLYPPVPYLGLNHSQDLRNDVEAFSFQARQFAPVMDLLYRPSDARRERVLTAIQWFNASNSASSGEQFAIVSLAIAFEALLGLSEGEKTERVVDSIALLLGRASRLDVWAAQFYKARSEIVHEGKTAKLYFQATDSIKRTGAASIQVLHRSLLSYGRRVFQLCVGTLLFGSELAKDAGLEEKLVTNQERFVSMCKILSDESTEPTKRLAQIDELINAVKRHYYVGETGIGIETIVGAVRLAATALLAADPELKEPMKSATAKLRSPTRPFDAFVDLDLLREFNDASVQTLRSVEQRDFNALAEIVFRLGDAIWSIVSMHYFWLKQEREKAQV
jgi:hypothetical protein